ncbi:MAG: hypothetical protein QOF68_2501 [Gaiellales bacterium]|nr:hypothetical protein [Gaiellales bacterium]
MGRLFVRSCLTRSVKGVATGPLQIASHHFRIELVVPVEHDPRRFRTPRFRCDAADIPSAARDGATKPLPHYLAQHHLVLRPPSAVVGSPRTAHSARNRSDLSFAIRYAAKASESGSNTSSATLQGPHVFPALVRSEVQAGLVALGALLGLAPGRVGARNKTTTPDVPAPEGASDVAALTMHDNRPVRNRTARDVPTHGQRNIAVEASGRPDDSLRGTGPRMLTSWQVRGRVPGRDGSVCRVRSPAAPLRPAAGCRACEPSEADALTVFLTDGRGVARTVPQGKDRSSVGVCLVAVATDAETSCAVLWGRTLTSGG